MCRACWETKYLYTLLLTLHIIYIIINLHQLHSIKDQWDLNLWTVKASEVTFIYTALYNTDVFKAVS